MDQEREQLMISSARLAKAVMRAHADGIVLSETMRCTPAQARLINRLSHERNYDFHIPNLDFVSRKVATRLIDQLLACPSKHERSLTQKQLDLIELLQTTKEYATETVLDRLDQLGVSDVTQLNTKQASDLLTALFQLPKLNNNN